METAVPSHPLRRVDDNLPEIEPRTITRFERCMVPLLAVAVGLFVASIAWVNLRPAPFQPLDYGTQRIVVIDAEGNDVEVPQVIGTGLIPSVHAGDPVPVIGDVCNEADEPVQISGIVQWNRLSPRGFNVETGRGINTVDPGCRSLGPFENQMPERVTLDAIGSGEPELWQISGIVNIDEENGGSTSWVTESFWIIP